MNSTIVRNKQLTYEFRDMYDPYPKCTGVAHGTKEAQNCNFDIFVYSEWCLAVHRYNHRQNIPSISKTQVRDVCV